MKDKFYIIIIIFLVLIIGILVGLNINSRNNNLVNIEKINNDIKDIDNKDEINIIENEVKDINIEDKNTKNEEPKIEDKYTAKDKAVIETLQNTLSDVKTKNINKESLKSTFITIVDFLFYDATIKGVTFKELSNEGKEKVLSLANKIDVAIESKVPNYKESITNTTTKIYNKASELIKKGSSNLSDFLNEKLSEEEYNSVINAKEEIVDYTKKAASYVKDSSSKILSQSKEKLNNWYQNYKNN